MSIKTILATLLVLCTSISANAAGISATSDPEAIDDLRVAKGSNTISEAWLIAPTDRYQHFVQGSAYEPGGVRVRLADGKNLTLMLGANEVFEDRQPRLADLDGDGRDELILVLSSVAKGASLAVYSVDDDAITLKAKTPFIGRAFRWLNPAGIADFNGDGQLDVAFVAMPHLVKRLEFWTLEGNKLSQIGTLDNVSNHKNGSPHIAMSAVADFNGDGIADLAVPSGDRRAIRIVSFADGKPREIDINRLPFAANGAFVLSGTTDAFRLKIPLDNGETVSVRF